MRKQIALMATVAALAITPALAQTTAPNQDIMKTAPQGQTTPAPSAMPADKSANSAVSAEKFINTQTSDQWLASDIMGLKVMGPGDENVGSISDLLIDKDGNIVAAVVGVGGFLGIGAKNVAISFDSLDVVKDKDGNAQARLTLSKKELESAPDFKSAADVRAEARRQTTPPAGSPTTPRKN